MKENEEQEEKKVSFVFYESWYDGCKVLNGKHRLLFLEAIINFGLYGEESDLEGVENALFLAIKPTIKFNKKQKENGLKGGGTQGNSNAKKTTQKRPKNDPNSPNILNDKDEYEERDVYEEPTKVGENNISHSRIGVEYYGTFHNVELLPQERRTLVEQYGEALVDETIDSLSCKLMDGNAQSNYHYATLQTWLRHTYKAEVPKPTATETEEQNCRRIWSMMNKEEQEQHLKDNDGLYPWEDPRYNKSLIQQEHGNAK